MVKDRVPMRRSEDDLYVWELIHWFTMTFLKRRITRGYSDETGKLVCVYWDKASNWKLRPVEGGLDYVRQPVPYPTPVWRSKAG
jgi:hypothetical protein